MQEHQDIFYIPSKLPYFKFLLDSCYTCRKLLQKRGRDVIAPLRSIGETDLVEGRGIMVDTCRPFVLLTKPKAAVTRETARSRRDTVKLYILISICMYSHNISAAIIDSMNTDLLLSDLHTVVLEHGRTTKSLAFDAGSSLIPAAAATAAAAEELHNAEEEDHDSLQDSATGARVVNNLREAGFTLRPPCSKASYKQSSVESSIKSYHQHEL